MSFKSKVNPVLFIAEVGSNHEGNFSEAKRLVINASKTNADVVKLQIFNPENMVSKKYDPRRYDHFKKLEIDTVKNIELLKLIRKYKKKTSASIWDTDQIFLFKKYIDIFKVGSGDIHNFEILDKILKTGKPLIISTGLSNILDIKETIKFIKKNNGSYIEKKKLAFLHCNTAYPTPIEDSNLGTINYLKNILGLSIGYSDHTIGDEILIYSYIQGAEIIEKHFSNNVKKKTFRDHAISLDKNKVNLFLRKLNNISKLMRVKKNLTKSEKIQNNLYSFRRSIYAKSNIKKGQLFSKKNIISLRPFIKYSSKNYFKIIKKKSKKNYKSGDLIDEK